MPASRDDFGIAIRSALLQKGAAQKFSLVSLIIVALIIFFLDVYNIGFIKPVRTSMTAPKKFCNSISFILPK